MCFSIIPEDKKRSTQRCSTSLILESDGITSHAGVLYGGLGLAATSAFPQVPSTTPLTAVQVVERIKANVGIPWREKTVDGIIVGSPDTPVHGIATTMMATLAVMQRAAAAGKNMVITHEPTFYSHQDTVDELKGDATYQYKLDFIRKNNMVSFHFHDHWHGHKPDGIAVGMYRELGWGKICGQRKSTTLRISKCHFSPASGERAKIQTQNPYHAGSGRSSSTHPSRNSQLGIRKPIPGYPAAGTSRH